MELDHSSVSTTHDFGCMAKFELDTRHNLSSQGFWSLHQAMTNVHLRILLVAPKKLKDFIPYWFNFEIDVRVCFYDLFGGIL